MTTNTKFTIVGGFSWDPSGPITDENGGVIGMASHWQQGAGAVDAVFYGVTGGEIIIDWLRAAEDADGNKEFQVKLLSRAQWEAMSLCDRSRCLVCLDEADEPVIVEAP